MAVHESLSDLGYSDGQSLSSMLRVFDYESAEVLPVTVRAYTTEPDLEVPLPGATDTLVSEFTVELTKTFSDVPGHAVIPALADRVGLSTDKARIRLEVMAANAERIWGFVTVTNNETQHVTIISPD